MAPVQLEVIHAPGSIGKRILELVPTRPGTALAGLPAGVGVDAELQALGMNVVGQRLDAVGETVGIGDDGAVRRCASPASSRR